MSLAIGDLELVAKTHAEQLLCPKFSQVDDLQGIDDLINRLVSLGFVLLSAYLFGISYQILEIPHGCLVACDSLGLPGNAQPSG